MQVVEGARLRGAAKIIGVDINPQKFELGNLFYGISAYLFVYLLKGLTLQARSLVSLILLTQMRLVMRDLLVR